jgi:hypothetical protein
VAASLLSLAARVRRRSQPLQAIGLDDLERRARGAQPVQAMPLLRQVGVVTADRVGHGAVVCGGSNRLGLQPQGEPARPVGLVPGRGRHPGQPLIAAVMEQRRMKTPVCLCSAVQVVARQRFGHVRRRPLELGVSGPSGGSFRAAMRAAAVGSRL